MAIQFLRELAAAPLPKIFHSAKDLKAIHSLCQAGLVLALTQDAPEGGVRVLAITDKGREELVRFHYPDRMRARSGLSWLELAAKRARSVLEGGGQNGTELGQ